MARSEHLPSDDAIDEIANTNLLSSVEFSVIFVEFGLELR